MKLIDFLKEDDDIYRVYDKAEKVASGITISIEELSNHLNKLGYELIGAGAFSRVFSKPDSDYVLKIVKPSRLNCTAAYLKLGRAANKNKHLPKVLKLKRFNVNSQGGKIILVAAVEKLSPFNIYRVRMTKDKKYNYGFLAFLAIVIFDIQEGLLGTENSEVENNERLIFEKFLMSYDNGNFHKQFVSGYPQSGNAGSFFKFIQTHEDVLVQMQNMAKAWVRSYSHTPFVRAFNIIQELRTNYDRCGLDLHEGNIMMRQDGTIVITDPVTG